jgi:hypothetical protein
VDEAGFRRFLRQRDKKEHVVDGLVRQVQRFEEYLVRERQTGLAAANAQELQAYVDTCEAEEGGSARVRLRGLALYFRFAGNDELASLASELREERIAGTRKSFPLKDLHGVDPDDVARLKAMGIRNIDQMLAAGRTPADREVLARRTGIAPQTILEYVKLADLARIAGVKTARARLYYDGGFDTLDKIAASDPEELRAALAAFIEHTGFEGIAPLPKETQSTVASAQTLPRIVEYE